MKKVIILLAVIISFQASAQLSMESGSYISQKVVRLAGKDADLFQNAQNWVEANMDLSKDRIYFDQDAAKILVNSTFSHSASGDPATVNYMMVLEFRNNMYRMTFKDVSYELKGKTYELEDKKLKSRNRIVKDINGEINSLSENLRSSMYGELMAKQTN